VTDVQGRFILRRGIECRAQVSRTGSTRNMSFLPLAADLDTARGPRCRDPRQCVGPPRSDGRQAHEPQQSPSAQARCKRPESTKTVAAYKRCTRRMNRVSFSSSSWLVDTGKRCDDKRRRESEREQNRAPDGKGIGVRQSAP